MADLIDKDKLIAAIVNNAVSPSNISDDEKDNFIENHLISYLNGKAQRQNEIIDIIKAQPTADTEKHAHWIRFSNCDFYCSCSNCGSLFYLQGETEINNYKYCPVCGAKMDEVMKE